MVTSASTYRWDGGKGRQAQRWRSSGLALTQTAFSLTSHACSSASISHYLHHTSPRSNLRNSYSSYSNRAAMTLVCAKRSVWKLQRAIAFTWPQLQGPLLILNLLLYFICPVSAVAALPQHHTRGPSFSSSTNFRLPKWHTSFIANSSLSTWGSTFTSGSRLVTMISVGATQGRPSSSQFHKFLSASHRPHNITTLPASANVTHGRDSTEFISPSLSRHLKLGDQSVTKTRHSTNTTSTSLRPSSNSTQANHGASSAHYSVNNISRSFSLSKNTTRPNDITQADVKRAKTSSNPPRISSVTLPSPPSSRSHPPYSFPSKTRFTLPPASSSTSPGQSSLASVTPKPSTTNQSVASDLSLSTNKLPFPLPPGCRLTAFESETYVLIPTERARKVPQQRPSPSRIPQAGADGYDHGPSSSTISQAGADGYDHRVPNPKEEPKPFDTKAVDKSPSVKIVAITLGVLVGFVPPMLAVPLIVYKFRDFEIEKEKKREKNRRKGPQDPAEEARDIYETAKEGKWTKKLALWHKALFKGWEEFDREKINPPPKPVIGPTAGQKWMLQKRLKTLHRQLHKFEGPTFRDEIRRLEDPFERDPGSCNYNSHRESQGCLEPPANWPRPAAREGEPERLTHAESLDSAGRLPRAREVLRIQGGMPWRILKVPEGYARLTLDGKIAYLGQNKLKNGVRLRVGDPRIRYYDNRCAAVGPGNSPLGGKDVDKLWVDKDGKLTLDGKRLGPESDIVQESNMLQSEYSRFVRQNFPSDRFEGGSPGSAYSSSMIAEDGSAEDGSGDGNSPGGSQGPPGKGKGKAKATSIEALEEGLTLAQKQAMDLQMDHDLAQTSDQIIRDWWEENHSNVGPSHVTIESMRELYWSQNNEKGPGWGDYTDWGNQVPEELPQTGEVEDPSNSNPDPEHGAGNDESLHPEDASDDRDARAQEDAMRDQIRKLDEALREEQRVRREKEEKIKEAKARQAEREQIRKADEAKKEEGKAREEKAKIKKEAEELKRLMESWFKGDEALMEDIKAREEAIRRLREARAREKAEEQAKERGRQGRGNGGG